MKTSFELGADPGTTQGKGASRRLRRSGKVPAFSTAGIASRADSSLDHQNLLTLLDNERFYSTILSVKVGDQTQAAILKDVQRHPAKQPDPAHGSAARAGEREDPHPHPAALQGRSRSRSA